MTRYYSEPQLELLRIIRLLGCLDVRQARAICRMNFCLSDQAITTLLRQLRHAGEVHEDMKTSCLLAVGRCRNIHIVQAVDIALAFASAGHSPQFVRSEKPCLLTAVFAEQDMQLRVFHVPPGKEGVLCQRLDDMQTGVQISTMYILLLDDATQQQFIQTNIPCVLAWPDHEGRLTIQKYQNSQGGDSVG